MSGPTENTSNDFQANVPEVAQPKIGQDLERRTAEFRDHLICTKASLTTTQGPDLANWQAVELQ